MECHSRYTKRELLSDGNIILLVTLITWPVFSMIACSVPQPIIRTKKSSLLTTSPCRLPLCSFECMQHTAISWKWKDKEKAFPQSSPWPPSPAQCSVWLHGVCYNFKWKGKEHFLQWTFVTSCPCCLLTPISWAVLITTTCTEPHSALWEWLEHDGLIKACVRKQTKTKKK